MRQSNHISGSDDLQSHVIEALRLPLIIAVVFVHNYTVSGAGATGAGDSLPIFDVTSHLFSRIITGCAIPLFFFISGFLFFLNIDFGKDVYKSKLKRRVKSLLIPYLFWNVLLFATLAVMACIPQTASHFASFSLQPSPVSFLKSLWCINYDPQVQLAYPISTQFWYIRDLMVMTLLTPLVFVLVKRTGIALPVISGLFWIIGFQIPVIGSSGFSLSAITFFSLGAWFSINRRNFVADFQRISTLSFLLFPISAVISAMTWGMSYNLQLQNVGFILGMIFAINLTAKIVSRRKLTESRQPGTARFSFFLFAVHMPWLLSQVQRLIIIKFLPANDLVMVILYFSAVAIVVLLAFVLYKITNAIAPRFMAVITGGR